MTEIQKRGYDSAVTGEFVWQCPYRTAERTGEWREGYIRGLTDRLRVAELRHVPAKAKKAFKASRYINGAVIIPMIAQPAIYFLLKAGIVQYIGQSQNVIGRLATHLQKQTFDEMIFIPTRVDRLNEEERRFIGLFHPPMNRTTGLTGDSCPYRLRKR